MPQVGILSMGLLQIHDHYNYNTGGPILTVARTNSANVRITNAAPRINNTFIPITLKRIAILQPTTGAMTLNYTLECDPCAPGDSVRGQAHIVRGGAAIWNGVLNTEAVAGGNIYTDANIIQNLLAGDLIDIVGWVNVGAGETCRISQMELCYDGGITQIARYGLTVPLAISDAGIVYQNVY